MSAKKGKKGDTVLLIPGATGWDVWAGPVGSFALKQRTEAKRALDVESLPGGDLVMAFPLRELSALPLRAPTTDKALFTDMADMHVERLGMRPAIESGVLSDCFEVAARGDETLLLPVVLTPPMEGTLPKRSPKAFDISARCFPMPEDAVAVWKELDRWVFAVGIAGRPLHFQALATSELDEAAGREIRLSITQLQIQGLLDRPPRNCFIWLGEEEAAPAPEQIVALGEGFGGNASAAMKPAPVFPPKPSRLLPADTRAERVAKRKRQQTILGVAAMLIAYFGLVGWLGWDLFQAEKTVTEAQAELKILKPQSGAMDEHIAKWEQLEPITDLDYWPVELLFRCSEAIPAAGLRFKKAEFHNQLEIKDGGRPQKMRRIQLVGEAEELEQVNKFNLSLTRRGDLAAFDWSTPAPTETKGGVWSFVYGATFKDVN
jgi:hypothetical protein